MSLKALRRCCGLPQSCADDGEFNHASLNPQLVAMIDNLMAQLESTTHRWNRCAGSAKPVSRVRAGSRMV